MTTPIHYYIYYPVQVGLEIDLARTLSNLQADLQARTGIAGRFLRKADDPWTWMEIYENVTDAGTFDAALDEGVARHGLDRFIDAGGRRHTERFVACA